MLDKLLRKVTARLNSIQGKGWGTSTCGQEVKQTLKFAPKPKIVLDVGGNVGDWTGEILKLAAPKMIYVFEPSKTNQSKLADRYKLRSNVTLLPYALSDSDGMGKLFTDAPGSGLASLHHRDLRSHGLSHDESEEVQLLSFSTFVTQYAVDHIDILKLDIEGHELNVLQSIPTEFYHNITLLQFEFGGSNLDSRTFFRDFWNLLSPNFLFFRVSPIGAIPIPKYREQDEHFVTTNYICLNRNAPR
jgi:FkbM family methyltransferase